MGIDSVNQGRVVSMGLRRLDVVGLGCRFGRNLAPNPFAGPVDSCRYRGAESAGAEPTPMIMNIKVTALIALLGGLPLHAQEPAADAVPPVRFEGLPLSQIAKTAALAVQISPQSGLSHYALGSARVLRAIEVLVQDLNRHGFLQSEAVGQAARMTTGAAFPKLPGAQAQPLDYAGVRQILERFQAALQVAAPDLLAAGEGAEFKMPVDLWAIRFDITGEGKEFRTLPEILRLLGNPRESDPSMATPPVMRVHFDRADAFWLAAYTQFLSAGCDALLAYNFEPTFTTLGPSLFGGVKSVFPPPPASAGWQPAAADFIASVHQIRWECVDPKRLARAHASLLQGVEWSRRMMASLQSETDDDAEWLPNEHQHGVPGIALGEAIQSGWPRILNEAQAVLEGRKLVPHWRFGDDEGINIKRVFTEPRPFDLILWLQGQAAVPYRSKGEISSRQQWEELTRVLEGGGFWLQLFYIN